MHSSMHKLPQSENGISIGDMLIYESLILKNEITAQVCPFRRTFFVHRKINKIGSRLTDFHAHV
jgi:hypothetical protein